MVMDMKVSIVIPAHNEEENIEKIVLKCVTVMGKHEHDYEIILVDDNSTDKTSEIADKLSRKFKRVNTIHRRPPKGFGLAVREGFKHSNGSVIIPLMADLSDDPEDIEKMLKKINEGCDIVLGSRFISGSRTEGYPQFKLIFGNRFFNNVFRVLYLSKFKDITNAFKAYRKEVLDSITIESTGFEITAEIALKGMIKGFRVDRVPVSWHGREKGSPKMNFLKVGPGYGKLLFGLWPSFIKFKLK
jgi:glycosyltransferase involved in cell wall biosynthesis